jgi:undecaprenyl-diphosphatase
VRTPLKLNVPDRLALNRYVGSVVLLIAAFAAIRYAQEFPSLNRAIFIALNGPLDCSATLVMVIEVLAKSPVLVAPTIVVVLWLLATRAARAALLATALAAILAQGVNLAGGTVVYDPRPFMVHVGHTFLTHAADNGFPSDHVTLVWTLGGALIATGASPQLGWVVVVYGFAVAWSRIWLGVHFPLDMVGSAAVALLVSMTARLVLPLIRRYLLPIVAQLTDGAVQTIQRLRGTPGRS